MTSRHYHWDRHRYSKLRSQFTLTDIEVIVMIIHAEVIHNHITDAITEALHNIVTPILIATAMTCHTEDHHHVEAYQPTPVIVAGPDHTHHTNKYEHLI